MNLINRIKLASKIIKSPKNYSLNDFNKDFEEFFYGGKKSLSGIAITEESAKKFTAFYACIKNISEDIGMIPIQIRKLRDSTNKAKGSDLAYDLPLHDLMAYEPNEYMNSLTFGETMQNHVLSSGNAYAYKYLDKKGRVVKLKLLNWQNIKIKRDNGIVFYEMDIGEGKEKFNFDEIFHIPGLGFDGLQGYSPVAMAMDAIGLGMAQEQFANYFFSNGANVGGFIELPTVVQDKEDLKKEFTEKFTGLGKSHKVLFLEQGMKFQKLVMPLREAQFIEGRRFQLEEIARIYRMPLHLIGDLERSTFSNIEHQELNYIKHTLLPWIRRWELAIDTRLLTKKDRQQGYFSQFDLSEMLRGDSITQANVNQTRRQNGVISTNEWRSMDNMNPRDEEGADKLYINSAMVELGTSNNMIGGDTKNG